MVAVVLACAPGLALAQSESPPAPAPVPPPPDEPSDDGGPCACVDHVALELGAAASAGGASVYGNGFGRGVVATFSGIEVRPYEAYSLEDRSGQYESATTRGRLSMTSLGGRFSLASAGRAEATLLVGAAWMRRSWLGVDEPDPELPATFEARAQHGIAAMAGVRLAYSLGEHVFLGAEARGYLTYWSSIEGKRVEVGDDGMTIDYAGITDSPGGIPMTVVLSIGVDLGALD